MGWARLCGTLTFALVAAPLSALAQVPANPALADSTWPLFHRNTYAQASGDLDAVGPGDRLGFRRLDNPERGTSPWTVLAAPYRDGTQAALGSVQGGVVKWLLDGEGFEEVSYVPVPRGRFDFDWYITVLASGEILTTSISRNSIFVLRDSAPDCPRCPLVIDREIVVPESVAQIAIHFTVSHDGHILILLEEDGLAAIAPATGEVVAVTSLARDGRGFGFHNGFAVDERGRIYITDQRGVTAVDWTGRDFRNAWQAAYDFRGPGCTEPRFAPRLRERLGAIRGQRCTGTGTTPTLIGTPDAGLVIMADGHAPANNLVGFWRGAIPADWRGIPGQDRRLAGRIALPLSPPEGEGHTAENSPAAFGNALVIAQWAGFNPDCSPPRGVQRVDWNPAARQFQIVWANPDVHFNGIPTVSTRTGLVYGLGRGTGCTYAFRGLDIATGALRLDLPLPDDDAFTDQGNQQTIAADGSMIIGVRWGQLRIHRVSD